MWRTKHLARFKVAFTSVVLFFMLSGCLILWGCSASQKDTQNVLLISIDTCRADHLSCYGFPRKTTPSLDRLAEDGLLFKRAYTSVPITLPAHSTMLTGTIPPWHGVRFNGDHRLSPSNITLAEILNTSGYTTGAIVSTYTLDSQYVINQGFETYNDHFTVPLKYVRYTERRGEETSQLAIQWLKTHKDDRFFLFLHYFDPHFYYDPPDPFKTRYKENPYAGEIAYVDHCIEKVFDELKKLDLYDKTIIIVTSDHGEMLGEHGEKTHSFFIYESAIRVPLIIKPSFSKKSAETDIPVGLVDIVPTVCGLLDIELSNHVDGINLARFIEGGPFPDQKRFLYCESLYPKKYDACSLMCIIDNEWKYILSARPELYELFQNPHEDKNLLGKFSQKAEYYKNEIRSILENAQPRKQIAAKKYLHEDDRKKLESLGYVSDSVKIDKLEFDKTGDDPKDLIEFHDLCYHSLKLITEEKYIEAEEICRKMIKMRPQVAISYLNMFKIAMAKNDFAKAIRYLEEVVIFQPDNINVRVSLGTAYAIQNQNVKATQQFKEALRIDPTNAKPYNNIGLVFASEGRYGKAITFIEKALQLDPLLEEAKRNLQVLRMRQQKKPSKMVIDNLLLGQ